MGHLTALAMHAGLLAPFVLMGVATASETIDIGDYTYRVIMNGVDHDGSDMVCHSKTEYLPMPEGYSLAPDTSDVRSRVVVPYTWSCNTVVLDSLKAYRTAKFPPAGQEFGDHQDKAVMKYIDGVASYRTPWTCYQVLVRRPKGFVASTTTYQQQQYQQQQTSPAMASGFENHVENNYFVNNTEIIHNHFYGDSVASMTKPTAHAVVVIWLFRFGLTV